MVLSDDKTVTADLIQNREALKDILSSLKKLEHHHQPLGLPKGVWTGAIVTLLITVVIGLFSFLRFLDRAQVETFTKTDAAGMEMRIRADRRQDLMDLKNQDLADIRHRLEVLERHANRGGGI